MTPHTVVSVHRRVFHVSYLMQQIASQCHGLCNLVDLHIHLRLYAVISVYDLSSADRANVTSLGITKPK